MIVWERKNGPGYVGHRLYFLPSLRHEKSQERFCLPQMLQGHLRLPRNSSVEAAYPSQRFFRRDYRIAYFRRHLFGKPMAP